MALVEQFLQLIASFIANSSYSLIALTIFVAVIIPLIIFRIRAKLRKRGANPFAFDCRRHAEPLVLDQAARDKVLKQGFVARKVPENLDAIVIGSGIGGLCTAALLAKAGKKVLVLEQHDQAGGCCHSFTDKGKLLQSFDHNVSLLGCFFFFFANRTLLKPDKLQNTLPLQNISICAYAAASLPPSFVATYCSLKLF